MSPIRELENTIDPSQPAEVFETAENRTRRLWAENSGDWAWNVLQFLQGRRTQEVSLIEVEQTQTYLRSTPDEQRALRFVAGDAVQICPPSNQDSSILTERDNFLTQYAAGETLGHADLVSQIKNIPDAVARSQAVDAALFPSKTFVQPELFSWIWAR